MVFKNVIYLRIVILYFKMRQIASVDLKDMKTLDDTEVWFRLLIHSIYNTLRHPGRVLHESALLRRLCYFFPLTSDADKMRYVLTSKL